MKHIIYLDANNLYGYAMSKFLLKSGFKRIDREKVGTNKYTSNSLKGYVPHHFGKEQHVIYYENVQLYLRLGLKLNKIYRVLESNQFQ